MVESSAVSAADASLGSGAPASPAETEHALTMAPAPPAMRIAAMTGAKTCARISDVFPAGSLPDLAGPRQPRFRAATDASASGERSPRAREEPRERRRQPAAGVTSVS